MKKLFLVFATMAVVMTACKKNVGGKDNPNDMSNCKSLTDKAASTNSAYAADPSKENCIAFKDALQAIVDGDCQSELLDKSTQGVINSLICN